MPTISEYEIQRAFFQWLWGWPDRSGKPTKSPALLPDALAWHVPNGGSRGDFEGKRLKESGVLAGIFDVAALHRGKYFVLELKAPDVHKLAPAQLTMLPRYHAAGAAGIAWCNSLKTAKQQFFAWGLTYTAV